MLSETLTEGLERYAIGAKVRALRLKKKMGLVELGRHTGLSPALLSKIERGRMHPTLPTLLRIAMVFSVGLEYFISGPRERPTVAIARRAERKRFPEKPEGGGTYEFESLDYAATERRMSAYYVEFERPRSGGSEPHAHAGAEFIYLLKGTLALAVGGEEHVIEEGDSVYFDSGAPHAYRRVGAPPCAAIVVTTP